MNDLYFLIPAAIVLSVIIFLLILHLRKKYAIQNVRSMNDTDKQSTLDHLAGPVGYRYDAAQDIFVSRLDAPQKVFGYTSFYDFSAAYFNMVFDYETIYFDYGGRTWLIEMWKGQYGINAGCELGVYYTDEIIPPEQYGSTLFKAVDAKNMLDISMKLNRRCSKRCPYSRLGHMRSNHWWLTIFNMGTFTRPEELFVNTSIRFKDYPMMRSFLESFVKTLPHTTYKVNGLTVYFTFYQSDRKYSFFKRFVRRTALASCRLYTKWFNHLTRPFRGSGDKLLYLYYYLPFTVRLLLGTKKTNA